MTGRGQSGRGRSHHTAEFVLESSSRRGRGRPRKFPLSTPIQMPVEAVEEPEADDEEFFQGDEEERIDMEKIKQIQHQKMILVTPMAQKRVRGRPPRQGTSSQPVEEEEEEEINMDPMESGPLEPSEDRKASSLVIGRSSRPRQAPKRHGDFVTTPIISQKPKAVQNVVESNVEDNIEPLIPNDAHIEDVRTVIPDAQAQAEAEAHKDPEEVDLDEILLEHDPDKAPPAPRHLINKANGRGRPANIIPPHRRPLPKDIVMPGYLKRPANIRDVPSAKRNREKATTDEDPVIAENVVAPKLHPPRAIASRIADDAAASEVKMESSEAAGEVVDGPPPIPALLQLQVQQQHLQQAQSVSTSSSYDSGKKREREAGKDLPSEHFPKEKARHVSTRGLHPFTSEKAPMVAYEVRDQIIEEIVEEEEDNVAQQRVLTLQGGSFIDDRIGRADMMEDEEMKMMKNLQPQQYIEVEENGMNVMYEVDPNDVIEGEEQVEGQSEGYVIQEHQMAKEMVHEEEEDDDLPPQLVPEGMSEDAVEEQPPPHQDPQKEIDDEGNFDFNMMDEGQTLRLQSPGGRSHDVRLARDEQGNAVFIDENGHMVELVTDTGALVDLNQHVQEITEPQGSQDSGKKQHIQQEQQQEGTSSQMDPGADRANLEFNFLDSNNICCGLCGEIVLYDKLVSEHLPHAHPEYFGTGIELEEVPYENWLKTRLKQESKIMENGFRHYDEHEGGGFGGAVRLFSKGVRHFRKVSQIRVNVNEMTMGQLEVALKRKLQEKMGRIVPVSLVDRLHARCDICQAVVSLNKKFEVIHLVRHFNAWHPSEHRCSQEWKEQGSVTSATAKRPLSLHDFSVVSTETDQNNLLCIWCGMVMDRAALGMHFTEVHNQQIVVPNCSLCLQEMVMTARLTEKYNDDYGISLPDEFHLQSAKLDAKFSSEKALDRAIDKHLKRAKNGHEAAEDDDGQDESEAICTTNSQQSFGKRNRLKRKFVKPCFRQICPTNSEFFEPKSACEWKCRLCNRNVYGAVISAGAIKHFKEYHPGDAERMQSELVKARLERIGDGSMEFVHPQLVECLICNLTYALHKPYNICRAIRHLRLKHPEVMPETSGKSISGAEIAETTNLQKPLRKPTIRFGETIVDPIELERFRKENFDQQFDKVQVVYGIKKNNEPAYILLMENEKMDTKTAMEMAEKVAEEEASNENRFDQEEVVEEIPNDEEERFENSESGYPEESKPQMILEYPEERIGEEEGVEMELPAENQYIPTYDANNPDHVLIEENDIMNDGSYEMIQEGEYQEIDEDNRHVQYMTEEEIRQAEERGEILEYEEQYIEEYVEQQ